MALASPCFSCRQPNLVSTAEGFSWNSLLSGFHIYIKNPSFLSFSTSMASSSLFSSCSLLSLHLPISNRTPSFSISPTSPIPYAFPSSSQSLRIPQTSSPISAIQVEQAASASPSPSRPPPVLPFRVGHGFDLHRLEPGYPLIIGGIDIPHDRGCEAHSDGNFFCGLVFGFSSFGWLGFVFPCCCRGCVASLCSGRYIGGFGASGHWPDLS